ncbi:MAG TPA: XdhC family protein [Anaerolineae bacterium]|mgnify:FL=1|nr:XdhC family protein [Anaerolineae bacterium]HQK13736.1 XdhC family protein [Anaerolineae bacterium]
MDEVLATFARWREAGRNVAVATIVHVQGSALRLAGARMGMTDQGEVTGSVSGGCIDSDALAQMEALLQGQAPRAHLWYGPGDDPLVPALACGGAVDILVEQWTSLHDAWLAEVQARRVVGFAAQLDTDTPFHLLRLEDGAVQGALSTPDLTEAVLETMAAVWPGPHAETHSYLQGKVYVEVTAPPPTLLIFGALDIAQKLAELGRTLEYQVIVADPRAAFLTPERFPNVERRLGWPQDLFTPEQLDAGYAVAVLFHDEKFDVPALSLALRSRAFYIGLLGSRRTQAARQAALREAGFTDAELARIHGPIGLNLGGREPAEIALATMAEIVVVRRGSKEK